MKYIVMWYNGKKMCIGVVYIKVIILVILEGKFWICEEDKGILSFNF